MNFKTLKTWQFIEVTIKNPSGTLFQEKQLLAKWLIQWLESYSEDTVIMKCQSATLWPSTSQSHCSTAIIIRQECLAFLDFRRQKLPFTSTVLGDRWCRFFEVRLWMIHHEETVWVTSVFSPPVSIFHVCLLKTLGGLCRKLVVAIGVWDKVT